MSPSGTNGPVADPAGYVALVLSHLGDDDPAEVQALTPQALATLVTEAGDLVTARPAPGEWSALEVVAHIVHAEVVSAFRYRAIVAEDEPRLAPYDQDRWVMALPVDRRGLEDALRMFTALRTVNLAMWAGSTDEQRARIGLHEERGPESYELSFRLIAGHDRLHTEQARAAVAGARG